MQAEEERISFLVMKKAKWLNFGRLKVCRIWILGMVIN
jgi:hypothetical protein